MRAWALFLRTLREQLRDAWVVVLAVLTAPVFVVLYWMLTGGGSTRFPVLLWSEDVPAAAADGTFVDAAAGIREAFGEYRYPDGSPMLEIRAVRDRASARVMLERREAAALVLLPAGLSRFVANGGAGAAPTVTLVGDLTHPGYAVSAAVAQAAVLEYVSAALGRAPVVAIAEEPLGGSGTRTEFENYVPGVFMIAVMMLLFSAPMAVAREVEAGTLRRLQLTRMTALDYLVGVSATQVLLGVLALLATLGVAAALGFRATGSFAAVIGIGALTAIPVIGVGLMVACFARTVTRAFLAANVPFMFFMFFSGAAFPVAKIPLFEAGGRVIGLFDFLPTTHAVAAVHRLAALGGGAGDVLYEIVMLAALSILYYAVGVWLFRRTHLRASA